MSVEKFAECVDAEDILGAILAIQNLRKLDKKYRMLDHDTPLAYGVRSGLVSVVEALIEAGAEINTHGRQKWTALHLASKMGHIDVVRLLLKCGAEVNARTEDRWTALHLASFHGHSEIAQTLLDAGGKIKAKTDEGETALELAIEEDREDVIKLLRAYSG